MIGAALFHPMMILGLGAALVYLLARLWSKHNALLAGATTLILALSLFAQLVLGRNSRHILASTAATSTWAPIAQEPGAMLVSGVALAIGLAIALYSGRYLALDRRYEDYYPLLLLLLAGVLGMVGAMDLFTLYLCAMLSSTTSYVLVAFRRHTDTAIEAGYKYAVLGGMGSMLLLAGVGLIYRSVGTLSLPLAERPTDLWGLWGANLILLGLSIKGAVFPAHTWLPDAHGRAPSSISALLSGIIVPSYLYALIKTGLGIRLSPSFFGALLVVVALATMTVGNLLALRQVYGKRLLGYSSVAHIGYMAAAFGVGLLADNPKPISAGLFLLVAHAAAKSLAFLCKGVFHFYCDASLVEELRGMGHRTPIAGAGFVLALAGLAGVPLLGGFMAKFGLLASLITTPVGIPVVAGVLLNSLLSLGYYLPLIGHVLRAPAENEARIRVSHWMQAPIVVLGMLVVITGVAPEPLLRWTYAAAEFLLSWRGR
ncbi:MAG: NADH dehydrogenase [Chloroflexi bacterium]|nr:NADH dehydrogenase [Chloroflexota bacterium]